MSLQVVYVPLILILLINLVNGDGHFRCKEHEKRALIEIKEEFVDVHNRLSSWTSQTDCCSNWRGVHCSNRTGHVTMLNLNADDYMPLRGNISLSLLKLRHLKYLDLSDNDFKGSPLFDFKGILKNLKYVDFSRSGFGGTLSYQFANLSRLQSLDLSFNNYLGDIASIIYTPENLRWLSGLSSIRVLDLSGVDLGRAKDWFNVMNILPYLRELRLSNCNLPSNLLGSMNLSANSSLEVIDLSSNHFTPSVYPWLLSLSNRLHKLSLQNNLLDGLIHDLIVNMTNLVDLDLSGNKLRGGVPKSFGRRLCNLQRLNLGANNLDGDLEILVGNISGCMEQSLEILRLDSNKLHGSLPDISTFSNLKEVCLSNNQLNDSVAEKFMHPSKLENLDLINNQLTGSIPDVAMLPFLKYLDFGGNRLNGTVSQSIGGLSEFVVLNASGNSLRGTLSELYFLNLSMLDTLDLSGNSLSLRLSPNWTPPFQLNVINLANCTQESGLFPGWIRTQKNCVSLDLSRAGIIDTVPSWFWDISSVLSTLNFSSNKLYGKLPDLSMKFFQQFPAMDLSSNNFTGELPLFSPVAISLNLSGNKFSGNISVLCRITNEMFDFLDLSDNLLTGKIPDCFGHWQWLKILNLANNRFISEIPLTIGNMMFIRALDLHNNSFYGNLPTSLSNCKELEFMDLSDNILSGTLPAWIGQNLSSLKFLSLKSNNLYGVIPRDFCSLKYLQILDLGMNNISGVIPQCIHKLTAMAQAENSSTSLRTLYGCVPPRGTMYNACTGKLIEYVNRAIIRWKGREEAYRTNLGLLRIIDLSSNTLSGEIPSEITRLVALKALNLSRNRLSGEIPRTIGDLKQIESFDLSRNHLSRKIPSSLSGLTFLSNLDLSNNNLSGRIPSGTQIQGFDASKFSCNPELCGRPLQKKCPGEDISEKSENRGNEDSDHQVDNDEFWKWLYAGIGFGFAVGFWGICITPLLKKQWRLSCLGFLDYLVFKFQSLLARFSNSRS